MKKEKQKNKGISLIVLVITIIVMIILAGSIIISLSNSGIINKANDAVDETDLKQVEQAALLAWADAYAGGTIDVDGLKDAVEQALKDAKVDLDKYEITVTTNGVTVKVKDTTNSDEENGSEVTAPTQLSAPTLTLSGNTLTITDNEANGSYTANFEVYVGDEKKATITAASTTTFDLTTLELETGTYTITVKAVAAEDSNITASEASEAIEYAAEKAVSTTLGALVASAENYGDTVNYTANDVTDWKVFYKQTVQDETTGENEEYVYLISSAEIPNASIPTKLADSLADGGAGATISESYVYWKSGSAPSKVATIERPALWLANWSDYSTNANGRCASYFLSETYWEAFKNTETYGDNVVGAIGTPTAEMFVASWNAKREAINDTTIYNKKLELVKNGTLGYYINDITTSETASTNAYGQSLTRTDTLYMWGESKILRLASPSGYTENCMISLVTGPDSNGYGGMWRIESI